MRLSFPAVDEIATKFGMTHCEIEEHLAIREKYLYYCRNLCPSEAGCIAESGIQDINERRVQSFLSSKYYNLKDLIQLWAYLF